MKYLGIDYGSKKLGIASSDDEGRFAFPCMVLPNDKNTVNEIKSLARELRINEIIFGDSVDQNGKPNPIMKEARAFALSLEDATDLPIRFEKEWMTSVHARESHNGKGEVDDSAAALILQRYLDRLNKAYASEESDGEEEEEEVPPEE